MNIVCGTDLTVRGALGSAVAAALAGKLVDKLLLVHAAPCRRDAGSSEVSNVQSDGLREKLEEAAARLDLFGAEIEQRLVTGYPAQAILSNVTPPDTRLVVLASRGQTVSNHGVGGEWPKAWRRTVPSRHWPRPISRTRATKPCAMRIPWWRRAVSCIWCM